MALESRRNPLPLPPIHHEELYTKPIEWKGCHPGWQETVCSDCRLNMHHTLASMRWNCKLRGPLKPNHSLDLSLSAVYKHGPEDFPDKSDVIRQPETLGYPTWRLLKNHRHDPNVIPIDMKQYANKDVSGKQDPFNFGVAKGDQKASKDLEKKLLGSRIDLDHPLRLGGLKERVSPFSAKVGISSDHSPPSMHGYNRNSYGAFYTS